MGLPDGPWSDEDRLLIVAHQMHEDGLCSCGHHRDEAYDPTAVGNYEVKTYVCEACAEHARYQHRTKDEDAPDGQKVTVYDATRYPD